MDGQLKALVLGLLALPHSHYHDELSNFALARSLYVVNNKVWDWFLCSHVIAAKQAHPHIYHQGQLYGIARVRCRGHFPESCSGERQGHLSHSCDWWQGLVVGDLVSLADVIIG